MEKMTKIILIIVMAIIIMNMKNIWAVIDSGEGRGDLIARELSYSV